MNRIDKLRLADILSLQEHIPFIADLQEHFAEKAFITNEYGIPINKSTERLTDYGYLRVKYGKFVPGTRSHWIEPTLKGKALHDLAMDLFG